MAFRHLSVTRRILRKNIVVVPTKTSLPSPISQLTTTVVLHHGYHRTPLLVSPDPSSSASASEQLDMENLYREWSLEQDQLLWENRQEPTVVLAAMLGRGLGGVKARLAKLQNVKSSAYERLFAGSSKDNNHITENDQKKKKLVPVSEVLRRIQWDYSLNPEDFSVLHYDRVEESIVESPYTAPNQSIEGSQTNLIDALPEHRIVAVKYKEQIVWDKEKRIDKVFGGSEEDGTTIEEIIQNYNEWKQQQDANQLWLQQRQRQMTHQLEQLLGMEYYAQFKSLTAQLRQNVEDTTISSKIQAEKYVTQALELFQQQTGEDMALEYLSEFIALYPHPTLQQLVLTEIELLLGQSVKDNTASQSTASNPNNVVIGDLPELDENDLTETFVKGSGAGGQKINKTNSKVVLLHNPTQLRVECQDTRSLQQNRKIARKRLRLKLDEYLNGKQSRTSIKAEKAVSKKQKAKARSRSRNRKKAAAKDDTKDEKVE